MWHLYHGSITAVKRASTPSPKPVCVRGPDLTLAIADGPIRPIPVSVHKNSETRRKGGDMRQAILQAACRAIVERGVDRVRMSDIARAAGVSATLPHYYFKTRSELLQRTFEYAEERMARLEQRVSAGRPPRERLERMLLVYFDADPQVFEIWMLAREMTTHAIREPALRDSHDDVYANWTSSVAGSSATASAAATCRRRSTPTGRRGA